MKALVPALMIICLSTLAQGQSFALKTVSIEKDTMTRFSILTNKDTCSIKTFGNVIPPTDCRIVIHKDSVYTVVIESSTMICSFPALGRYFGAHDWDFEFTPPLGRRYYEVSIDYGGPSTHGAVELTGRNKGNKPVFKWISKCYSDWDGRVHLIKD